MRWMGWLTAGAVWATTATAGDGRLEQAMDAWCETVKRCTLAQMQGQDVPPEMKAMVEQMTHSMCARMDHLEDAAARTHELYEPAVQCLNSMSRLSCEALESADETPECKRYQERTQAHSQ